MAEEEGKIKIKYVVDDTQLQQAVSKAMGSFKQMSRTAETEGNKVKDMFATMAKAAGGFFSVAAAMGFAKQIVAVRKEVESLEISFGTLLGSEQKAASLMRELSQFAAKTPLQLNDLAKGAQMLLSFNVEAERVMPILHAIGDISMGDAGKLQSLTLAFSQMSSTGRLMGQDLLQMINAGFNPLTVIAEKTGKSVAQLKDEMSKGAISAKQVEEAFIAVTSEGGKFYNMLEKQSKGLGGSISNLQGAIRDMMNDIGKSAQSPLTSTVQMLTKLVQNYKKVGVVLANLVAVYGSYKAALLVNNALTRESVTVERMMHLAKVRGVAATKAQVTATVLLNNAQKLLNKTMLANPYVLLGTLIGTLILKMTVFRKKIDEAAVAQETYNNLKNGIAENSENTNSEIEKNIAIIQDETSTVIKRTAAYKELVSMFPSLFEGYKKGTKLTEEQKKVIDELVSDRGKMNSVLENQQMGDLQKKADMLRAVYDEMKYMDKNMAPSSLRGTDLFKEFKESDSGQSIKDWIKSQLDATDKLLDEWHSNAKDAEWAELPIDVKIKNKEDEITRLRTLITWTQHLLDQNPFNIKLKVDLDDYKKQLAEAESEKETLQASEGSGMTDKELLAQLKKQNKAVNDARNALKRNTDKNAVSRLEKDLEDKQSAYDSLDAIFEKRYGQKYSAYVKSASDAAKKRAEDAKKLNETVTKQEKEMYDARLELRRKYEQAAINIEQDGAEKTKKQIEHNYQLELDAIEKQARDLLAKQNELKKNQWLKSGKKEKDFVADTELDADSKEYIEGLKQSAEKMKENQLKEATQQYLANYLTYYEKIAAAEKRYADTVKNFNKDTDPNYDAHVSSALKQLENEKKDINREFANRSKDFEAWASYVSNLALDKLKVLLQQLEAEKAKLPDDADQDTVAELEARIEHLKDQIASLTAQKNAKSSVNDALGIKQETVNNLKIASQVLGSMGSEVRGLIGEFVEMDDNMKQLVDTIIDMGVELAKSGIEDAIKLKDATAEIGEEVENIAKSADWITMIVKVLIEMVKLFVKTRSQAGEDAKKEIEYWEKEVQRLQDAINDIDFSNAFKSSEGEFEELMSRMSEHYKELYNKFKEDIRNDSVPYGYASEDYYSMAERFKTEELQSISSLISKISAEYKNMEGSINKYSETIKLYTEQVRALKQAEESARQEAERLMKLGKDNQAEEYTNQANEYADRIKEALQNAAEYINQYMEEVFGGSAMSLAEKFGDAIIDAFKSGADAAVAFGETVNDVMRNMVRQLIYQKVVLPYIGELLNKYEQELEAARNRAFRSGDKFNATDWWLEQLDRITEDYVAIGEQLQQDLGNLDPKTLEYLTSGTSTSTSSRGIAQASQDSIDELNGRMTMIQEHTAMLSGNMVTLVGNTNGILLSVKNIDNNVEAMNSRMSDMAGDIRALQSDVNYIRNVGINAL